MTYVGKLLLVGESQNVSHGEAPIERVIGYDVPVPLFVREDDYLPGADRIKNGISRTLEFE